MILVERVSHGKIMKIASADVAEEVWVISNGKIVTYRLERVWKTEAITYEIKDCEKCRKVIEYLSSIGFSLYDYVYIIGDKVEIRFAGYNVNVDDVDIKEIKNIGCCVEKIELENWRLRKVAGVVVC
jgi:hypothetical protein